MSKQLCLILGDQLSHNLSSLACLDKDTGVVLMAEVKNEATYVKHHKKKVAFIFSAMRHFAYELSAQGYKVLYRKYDDPKNKGSLFEEVKNLCSKDNYSQVFVTQPGEYRLLSDMQTWQQKLDTSVTLLPDERFLADAEFFNAWAKGKKQLRMEFFYREMRKKYGILMENGQPVGGKWNYDAQNRKKLPKEIPVPAQDTFEPDEITEQVVALVAEHFDDHFGDLEPFQFAVTREQACKVLDNFIEHRLPEFGTYQDAMKQGEDWLFHSHISFYLNVGLLSPMEAIEAAEHAWRIGAAPLNAVEGFVRQVLGWREYVRGLYWYLMPEYKDKNFLAAKRALPDFYWSGETKMNCMAECVRTTKQNAYAHHIQRLMVLGNFALLAGLHPDEVNEWYLLVYADAFEWVELPNVTGMILFADGGTLASKPYAASGSYINKMSDYCKGCHYKVQQKLGEQACPFNYMYWNFLIENQASFAKNPRMSMIYNTLGKKSDSEKRDIQQHAHQFFQDIGI
ncbi:cryptochrome/photolyase family protein [Planctobacterium marinum]|uniref:Cryptochrome/photolyase family protein n=1 Tax=Planctobacterium marinum TaxID=1631968 RepID=A0AA48I543_9ALTE|nr:cryptochrome/photolyase family protein [Planctobacterium marinum]